MTKVTDQQIIDAAASHSTMRQAAQSLNVHESSFIPRAKRLGVYKPNQGRKGHQRSASENANLTYPLSEILAGMHPQYGTPMLKKRLLKAGILPSNCVKCGVEEPLTLDHIDGDNSNHRLNNLRIMCHNCHAKTPTYAGRNKKCIKAKKSHQEIAKLILMGLTTRQVLTTLSLVPNGVNYKRVDYIRDIVEVVRAVGLEPTRPLQPADFESAVVTNFTTPAQ